MKTKFLTILTTIVIVLSLSKTTSAAAADNTNITILNDISRISKIEVRGNVELYVSDGPADEVKVYNKYYSESALIQNINGVLRISSYKAEKLIVWVTAYDLRAISAYDNASVKSFGNLSKIELDVDLHNNSTATLNVDAYSANVNVADRAKAVLTGSADELNLNHNLASTVNNNNFKAARYNETTNSNRVFAKSDDIAGI